jgi:hypothetical protein
MWKVFFEVLFAAAVLLAVGNLTDPKRIQWWLAIFVFVIGAVALVMWLHDAAHVTFVARRVDARRARKREAGLATLRAEGARLRALEKERIAAEDAIKKERGDAEAAVDRDLWITDHYCATRGAGGWTVALTLKPPRGIDPHQISDQTAGCIVWHEDVAHRSVSEAHLRGSLGFGFAFPHDFEPRPEWPLAVGRYEVEWVPESVDVWMPDVFNVDEQGYLDGHPFGFTR